MFNSINDDRAPYLRSLFFYAGEILLVGLIEKAMESLIQDSDE